MVNTYKCEKNNSDVEFQKSGSNNSKNNKDKIEINKKYNKMNLKNEISSSNYEQLKKYAIDNGINIMYRGKEVNLKTLKKRINSHIEKDDKENNFFIILFNMTIYSFL
jgi:hypothetical protein